MADKIIKYQFETNASEVSQDVNKLDNEFKGLDATFEEVYGELQPLTGRLSQLQDRMYELAQAGDTASAEFRELSKEASRLKNVQKEVDLQLDRTARTMSEKFSSGVNLVTGSMVLAEGAMSAIGVSAEDSEALMASMFNKLAAGQALLQIEEATGWFSALGRGLMKTTIATKIATKAQWLWNAAQSANPIGLIVAGVAALVTGIIALTSWMSVNTKEAEANAKAIRDISDANKEATAAMNRIGREYAREKKQREDRQKQEIEMTKTKGATMKDLQAMEEKNRKENLEANRQAIIDANKKAKQGNAESIKLLGQLMVEKEALQDQELTIKNKYILLAAQADAVAAQAKADKLKTDAATEATEQAARDAAKAQREAEWFRTEFDRLTLFLKDTEEARVTARRKKMEGDEFTYKESVRKENARYKEELLNFDKALELKLISQEEYDEKVKAAETTNTNNLKVIETTEATRKQNAKMAELSKELNDIGTSFERKKEILEAQRKWILDNTAEGTAERFALISKLDQDEAALEEAARQRKLANASKIAQMTGSLISSIQAMQNAQFAEDNKNGKQDEKSKEKRAKKQFEAQKKLNIAMAVVNASQAIISSLAQSPVSIAGAPSPLGIASLAVATASGIASIAAIRKTTFQGGGGGNPEAPKLGSAQSPTFNTVGQSQGNVNSQTEAAAQQSESANDNPTRAFVVSTDITSQQELDRAIESQGELG